MASCRMYMDFTGYYLPNSPFSFGGTTYYTYLLDSSTSFGSNFPFPITELKTVPPTATAGLACDHTFIYRTPFYKNVRIEGPLNGNMVLQLATNDAPPAAVYVTDASVEILAMYSDGTYDIIENIDAFQGSYTAHLTGSGTATRNTIGFFYTGEIDCKMTPEMLLGIRVRTYGYKTTSSSNLSHYIQINPSAKDVFISLPFVGV